MTKADGSVVIDTRIDTGGFQEGTDKMVQDSKSAVMKLAHQYKKSGMSMSEAMKKAYAEMGYASQKAGQQATKSAKSFTDSIGSIGSSLGKIAAIIGTVFSVKAIVNFGTESSKAAMQLSDSLTGLQSILNGQGRSFSDVQAFIEEYTKDGLIPATNAITAFKNLASRGYDDSQIKSVMIALKDASAFGRQASYTMGDAVQSATEGLKNENSVLVDNAGVTKNVAKMWEEYAASIGTTANNLTQQQKIQAEVTGILAESKFQIGDAAKVSGTLSGQLQQLSFGFNNLKVAAGNIANPIVQAFLPAVNAAVTAVTKLANSIAAAVGSFFGKAVVQTESIAEAAASGAEAEEALASGIESAAKAAKKSVSGFDQLTKLQEQTADGGGVGSSIAAGSIITAQNTTLTTATVEDNVTPKIQEIAEKIKLIFGEMSRIFAPAAGSWKNAFAELAPVFEDAGNRISAAWSSLRDNTLKPFGDYLLKDFIPSIANDFSTTFAPIFTDVMAFAVDSWALDFENASKLISDMCGGLRGTFEDTSSVFSDMCASITQDWSASADVIANEAGELKKGLWDSFWGIYNDIIRPVFDNWGTKANEVLTKYLAPLWKNVSQSLGSIGENLLHFWNNAVKPVIDYIIAFATPHILNVINTIIDAASVAWGAISGWLSSIMIWLDGLIEFLVGVFTLDFSRALSGIERILEGMFETLNTTIRSIANGIIYLLNTLWSGVYSSVVSIVNGLGSVVRSAGKIVGKDWGFSLPAAAPKIPYLAKGAVIPPNAPFMAVLGDQRHGTNIEAPLSTIQEAVASVMADYQSGNMAGHEATVGVLREILDAVLGVEIGDRVIGEAYDRYSRKQAVIRGGNA